MKVFIEIIIVLLLCFPSTFPIEESFCAGTGYSNMNQEELGLKSVGYHYVYSHPLATIWAANHITSSLITRNDGVEIQLRLVEQKLPTGTRAQLNGWLHVHVMKRSRNFEVLALWAATDTREPIGEFFNLTGVKGCTSWEQAREILPCSAAPIDASINPNMFVYTNTARQSTRKIQIFWKMSTAYCSKPKKIRFYAVTNSAKWKANAFLIQDGDSTDELGPLIYTTPWIEPKFSGAASPVYDKSSITCRDEVYRGSPVWLKKPSSWTLTEIPEPKWLLPRWKSDGTEDIKVARERATCKAAEKGYIHHGGRCKSKVNDTARTYAGLDVLPTCNHVAENFDAEDLKLFKDSLSNKLSLMGNHLKGQCECPEVPTPEEVIEPIATRGLKKRRTGLKNYQHKAQEDDDVDTMDGDDIHYGANANFSSPSSSLLHRNSTAAVPVLLIYMAMADILSNNITNASSGLYRDRYGYLNFTTTTDDPDYLRVVEEFNDIHKDDGRIKCALHHKNFSNFNDLGLCVDSLAGRIAYGVRQWHATATLLCTVVLVPVASYMARYHKGALPINKSGAMYIPVKVWYIVHILIILPILCLYTTGMVAIRRQRSVLGYSLTYYAKFHRIAGTILMVLMAFQILTGFFRPFNMFYRRLATWVHFLIGLLINYGGLVICILTYRIPGSPTSFYSHVDTHVSNPIRKHVAPMILTFWGAVDIAYQAFITVHIIQFDKSVGVHRSYFPVIIPVLMDQRLQFDDEYDKEQTFQKGTFTAYIIFAIFIFFITCIAMYCLNDERGQGFGPMYCTHDEDGNFLDPSERGQITNKRRQGYCN